MDPSQPENPDDETDATEAPGAPPARSSARPDWLVGADEGANAEMQRNRGSERRATPLRLVRPGEVARPAEEDEDGARPDDFERLPLMRVVDTIPGAASAGKPRKPGPAVAAWQAASSSIPKLPRTAPAAPAARTAPAARPARRDLEDEDEKTSMPELSDDTPSSAAPLPALKPLEEAWWLVALDAVQTNRHLQILLVVLFVALGVVAFQPWQPRPISLSRIRRHSEQFDGHAVMVHGRVGDVFPIAGGYTYFLLQGRDTIVVFTHGTKPVMDQRLTVHGMVSTGYLDGLPRQAIFEDTK